MKVRIEGENAAVVFTSGELRQVVRSLKGMVPREGDERDACIRLAVKMLFGQRAAHQEMIDRVDKLVIAAAAITGAEVKGRADGNTKEN